MPPVGHQLRVFDRREFICVALVLCPTDDGKYVLLPPWKEDHTWPSQVFEKWSDVAEHLIYRDDGELDLCWYTSSYFCAKLAAYKCNKLLLAKCVDIFRRQVEVEATHVVSALMAQVAESGLVVCIYKYKPKVVADDLCAQLIPAVKKQLASFRWSNLSIEPCATCPNSLTISVTLSCD